MLRSLNIKDNCSSFLSFFFIFFIILSCNYNHVYALNIGVQATGTSVSVSKGCSRKCESDFCSGEKPCDGLDACCMKHDDCVQSKNNDYLSQECSQKFLNCMKNFKNSGGHTFKGNTCEVDEVIDVITLVMEAALLAGRYLHKP
ncbi:hypothetical protein L484_005559 [Morus notabilis]|uniref:Phospholipase A2-alpha n=1 Tax=Morus notabilis TaxID=981085 RepID=W9R3P7_9ROSA|nr:hypothetical protein L484_005559 [Morus notabilis]